MSASGPVAGMFHDRGGSVALQDLGTGWIFGGKLESFGGGSVLLAMREQLGTALALLELDGVARRVALCTPDLTPEQLALVSASAEADMVLDSVAQKPAQESLKRRVTETTEWVLLTSGTTGEPKLVVHSFDSLAGALPRHPAGKSMVGCTSYDIRRAGGLETSRRPVRARSPLALSRPSVP